MIIQVFFLSVFRNMLLFTSEYDLMNLCCLGVRMGCWYSLVLNKHGKWSGHSWCEMVQKPQAACHLLRHITKTLYFLPGCFTQKQKQGPTSPPTQKSSWQTNTTASDGHIHIHRHNLIRHINKHRNTSRHTSSHWHLPTFLNPICDMLHSYTIPTNYPINALLWVRF